MHWVVRKAFKLVAVKLLKLAIGRAAETTRDRLR